MKQHEETDVVRKAIKARQFLVPYEQGFNIITLEKTTAKRVEEPIPGRSRLLPAKQVDYNIINNNKLEDYFYLNVKKMPDIRTKTMKNVLAKDRDFNIISNMYWHNHDDRAKVQTNRLNDNR